MDARPADGIRPGGSIPYLPELLRSMAKGRHARRRLTSNEFFKLYDKVLTADGTVEFKTDNRPLFDFSVEELKTSELFVLDQLSYDLHNDSKMNQGNIMTEYEAKFSSMGNPICKLIAKRR